MSSSAIKKIIFILHIRIQIPSFVNLIPILAPHSSRSKEAVLQYFISHLMPSVQQPLQPPHWLAMQIRKMIDGRLFVFPCYLELC
mmetsp:Transcript_57850/g.64707  ORF Transcript_57850/g.64707 Transcript_57850/m.64707 type:complete len:85 (+) Transcript_57850:576-830(+)